MERYPGGFGDALLFGIAGRRNYQKRRQRHLFRIRAGFASAGCAVELNRPHYVRDAEVLVVPMVSDAACETDVLSTCSGGVLAVPKVREACAMA